MSKSSNYRRAHESDETFTRAAWETAGDAEASYDVEITWQLSTDEQRGVWRVVAVAWDMKDGRAARQVARCSGSYPNSRAGSLSAYLFSVANMLAMQVDSARKSEENERQRRA